MDDIHEIINDPEIADVMKKLMAIVNHRRSRDPATRMKLAFLAGMINEVGIKIQKLNIDANAD